MAGFFERCCAELSEDGLAFTLEVFTDSAVGYLLNGLTRAQFDCVIFASNALLSDDVLQATIRHKERLGAYVASGGGLVLLHQIGTSTNAGLLSSLLPAELSQRVLPRDDWNATVAQVDDPADVLLRYPDTVDCESLGDRGRTSGPRALYWTAMTRDSLPAALLPVLSIDQDRARVLLVRSPPGASHRVVITTLPLDWQGNSPLMKNTIRYACLGEPRRLLWRRETTAQTELFLRWIHADGATAVRPLPPIDDGLASVDHWLLSRVGVVIVPAADLPSVSARSEIRSYLARGGTLITSEPDDDLRANRIAALVGSHTQRALSDRLFQELQAVEGWDNYNIAFELRNLVSALAYLRDGGITDPALAVAPSDLAHLVPGIRSRLSQDEHRQDLNSSIALGEVLCHLVPPPRRERDYFAWMAGPSEPRSDVLLQIHALRSLWRGEIDPHILPMAVAILRDRASGSGSLAPVARILDALAMLDQGRLLSGDAVVAEELAELVCTALDEAVVSTGSGWMSVATTADITRGVCALMDRVAATDSPVARRLATHLATGIITLRHAVPGYRRDPSTVTWLARVIHAIILVDVRFPLGLRRLASLDWPSDDPYQVSADDENNAPLVSVLAVQNKELRQRNGELMEQRLAASIGRITVAVVVVGVTVSCAALMILKFSDKSIQSKLANVGWILPALIALLTAAFEVLRRAHLLAAPAAGALDRVKRAASALPDIGKFKNKS